MSPQKLDTVASYGLRIGQRFKTNSYLLYLFTTNFFWGFRCHNQSVYQNSETTISIVSFVPASFYVFVWKPLHVQKHVPIVCKHSYLYSPISSVKLQLISDLELLLLHTLATCVIYHLIKVCVVPFNQFRLLEKFGFYFLVYQYYLPVPYSTLAKERQRDRETRNILETALLQIFWRTAEAGWHRGAHREHLLAS